jgi:phosphoribosylpyrophosphate synthetase
VVWPYFPYGRADKEHNIEKYTLREMVGSGFTQHFICDPHSDACLEWMRAKPISIQSLIKPHLSNYEITSPWIIVAPDKGAMERATLVASSMLEEGFNVLDVVFATKVRNPEDNSLSNPIVEIKEYADFMQDEINILVVDDISDAGGTFVQLARAIKAVTSSELHIFCSSIIQEQTFINLAPYYASIATAYRFSTRQSAFHWTKNVKPS